MVASCFLAFWLLGYAYLREAGWNPVRPVPYLVAGCWTSAVLLLRRAAPMPCFVVTVLFYPLVFDPPLQTEFQLLPILVAAYAAAGSRLRSALVAVAAMTAVFVMTVVDVGYGPGPRLVMYISWDTVLVHEFATVCVVAVATLMHEQRRNAEVLAERNAELERLRAVEADRVLAAERTRIARELHDVVAHHLTAVIVRVQAADRVAANDPEATRATLQWVATTAREALTSMRQTVGMLRADGEAQSYAPEPSIDDLPVIVGRMEAAGLDVTLAVESDVGTIDQATELSVVRIAQEALTNTLRHARATRAVVSLRREPVGLVLDIDDDGAAATADGVAGPGLPGSFGGASASSSGPSGHGIVGMRERAASCGGSLDLSRSDLGGWRVRATFPTRSLVAP